MIKVEVYLNDAREVEAFARFLSFLEGKRSEQPSADAPTPAPQQEAAPDVAPDEPLAETSVVDVAPAPAETKPSTTADVIAAVRALGNDKIPAIIALCKEFNVKRVGEITDQHAADFLDRLREVA